MLPVEIESFFLQMKNPDYLPMKLLSDVLIKMKSDEIGKKIVDNINNLNEYEISLIDLVGAGNSVLTDNLIKTSKMKLSIFSQEGKVAYEFAHLLLDLYSKGELPDEYSNVNAQVRNSLLQNGRNIALMLSGFSEYLWELFSNNIGQASGFVDRHPEVIEKYLRENEGATYEDFLGELIGTYFLITSETDYNAINFNKIGNVIDASFHGKNPFMRYYSDENGIISPLVASHFEDEFLESEVSPEFMGFEEQFSEYFSMRLYKDELRPAIDTLRNFIGDEWFSMMDSYYERIASRVEEGHKVYVK